MSEPTVSSRVRLPADVELEDKLAFGLTARQLCLLGATALIAYALYTLAAPALPLPIALALCGPVVIAGSVLALGRRDGLPADRLARCATRYLAKPRRRLLAPEGLPAPLSGEPRRTSAAPLDLPIRTVFRSGLVELCDGSFCLGLRSASGSFALKSDEEQAALVEAFGRFLNSVTEPVAIYVRSEPVDLAERAAALDKKAATLDEPTLVEAAHSHARFLRELPAGGELRRREILLLLCTRARDAAGARSTLERRAGETTELLRAAGVQLSTLDGEQTAALLARAFDPPGPPAGCALDGVITRC
ncbi:MAG TPA: PrgI family protein [Gaiellaceae bacterium]|nr:PrgI family protein [Gaiellaceae bacterium]